MGSAQQLDPNKAGKIPGVTSKFMIQACLFLLVTFFGFSNTILTILSRNEENRYDYETVSVPLCMELAKLTICFVLLLKDCRRPQDTLSAATLHAFQRIRDALSWQYGILTMLYAFQNNLIFLALRYLDPGTYHVLGNLRIPIVAVMLALVLKKSYSKQQISGMVMLTTGAILYSIGKYTGAETTSKAARKEPTSQKIQFFGYFLALIITLSASIAGVFNEYCLKERLKHQSVDLQNLQLYLFGFILNLMALFVKQPAWLSIFGGYNMLTVCIILNSTCFGISVGYITKYCDNNVRSFAGMASMLLAALYSYIFMSTPLPDGYPVSLSLVSLAAGVGTFCFAIGS
ncbi:hypothetical protein M9434_007204 [Picochlorum sp. BPE23]|nr:hypothetical protein M9434_007204 [Picochlorum sp. BPE23]